MGGAGFLDLEIGKSHKTELGYWLAKRFWGQGIMTRVIKKLVTLGFEEFGLKRITATIFAHNTASQRCLEKNHFVFEGQLKNYYFKDKKLVDAKLFAIFPS
jgi:RimJ/RimL family protein N-acetyltransferase